eukprot:12306768-Karenia_brevis.AAC.1
MKTSTIHKQTALRISAEFCLFHLENRCELGRTTTGVDRNRHPETKKTTTHKQNPVPSKGRAQI